MFFSPRTPSSENDPFRLSKSLSFNADTGMMLCVEVILMEYLFMYGDFSKIWSVGLDFKNQPRPEAHATQEQ